MSPNDPPHLPDPPSRWVGRFHHLISKGGVVLDLAGGSGRHARLLAAAGLQVHALDRDAVALGRVTASGMSGIHIMQMDLEVPPEQLVWPFAIASLDGIVVTNYLHRPLFAPLLRSLAPQGVFIMETFAVGNAQFGKPSNPQFLLQPGELLQQMQQEPQMRVIAYEDGYVETPKAAMVQRICAIKQGFDCQLQQLGPI